MEKKFVSGVAATDPYETRDFTVVRGLHKLPDSLIEAHVRLYEGYVRNLNLLNQHVKSANRSSPEWSELKRRLGFEYAGMRLHELYFEGLSPTPGTVPAPFEEALSQGWGSIRNWKEEFESMGQMRGVGWVLLDQDPLTGRLSNHWITLHEDGHPPGFTPILVMDVWEHAYTGMSRSEYVEAFFLNIHWAQIARRLTS